MIIFSSRPLLLLPLGESPGDVVGAEARAEILGAEPFRPVGQGLQGVRSLGVEPRPVARVLFRPEEVVLTSSSALVDDTIFREYA